LRSKKKIIEFPLPIWSKQNFVRKKTKKTKTKIEKKNPMAIQ